MEKLRRNVSGLETVEVMSRDVVTRWNSIKTLTRNSYETVKHGCKSFLLGNINYHLKSVSIFDKEVRKEIDRNYNNSSVIVNDMAGTLGNTMGWMGDSLVLGGLLSSFVYEISRAIGGGPFSEDNYHPQSIFLALISYVGAKSVANLLTLGNKWYRSARDRAETETSDLD